MPQNDTAWSEVSVSSFRYATLPMEMLSKQRESQSVSIEEVLHIALPWHR